MGVEILAEAQKSNKEAALLYRSNRGVHCDVREEKKVVDHREKDPFGYVFPSFSRPYGEYQADATRREERVDNWHV